MLELIANDCRKREKKEGERASEREREREIAVWGRARAQPKKGQLADALFFKAKGWN